MIEVGKYFVSATATGNSDSLRLGSGWWTLHVTSAAWGAATVQVADIVTGRWSDVNVPDVGTELTENTPVIIPGNCSVRLSVASLSGSNPIQIVAQFIE